MSKVEGKVAVITGGNSGIGLATAQRFVAEGAYVFITGRRQSELDAAVKQLGKNVTAVQGDVSILADLDRLYTTVKQQKGHIGILFPNAGTGELAPLGAITEEHFDKIFNANVKGLLFTVQKALPLLKDGSSIILNASIVSSTGSPAFSVYSASKAAVRTSSFSRNGACPCVVPYCNAACAVCGRRKISAAASAISVAGSETGSTSPAARLMRSGFSTACLMK